MTILSGVALVSELTKSPARRVGNIRKASCEGDPAARMAALEHVTRSQTPFQKKKTLKNAAQGFHCPKGGPGHKELLYGMTANTGAKRHRVARPKVAVAKAACQAW